MGMYQNLLSFEGYLAANAWIFPVFILLIIWSVIWKGIALWKSARNGSMPWFIVLLVFNTVGILEILYTFWFGRKRK